ncbi:SpoIIE family protein phosphatase [Clostridium minihomine]|uniref:SpoIIE family protein phosphatase n=1 Tax=Clostridium minihomine TaxID=2045012 RepID=UPI001FB540A4|nr:SpoIIE family protein phosphatase [Clostridium minihomine]
MMKEKAVVRQRLTFGELLETPAARKIMVQVVCFAVGFACSRAIVFGRYAPFGVAAVGAVPFGGMWGMVLGVLLGYLLPTPVLFPVRYVAAVLAAAAIRWTLNDLVKLRMHPFFAPLISFAPVLMTGLAMAMVNGTDASGVAMYVAESLLAAGGAYFLVRSGTVLLRGKGISSLKNQDLACVTLSLGILVLAFSNIKLGGISLGHVIAVIGILFAARYGGVTGGSVTGIGAGVILSLSTAGVSYLSGAYALGGMMAGVFSPLGRLVSASAFVVSNAVASLQVGSRESVLIGLYEVMAATVIYMVWPKDVGSRLSAVFTQPVDLLHSEGLRRSVIMKLDYAAKALENISDSVEEVSRRLDKFSAPDINGIYSRVIDNTCIRCGLRVYCWERNYNDTMQSFNDITQLLRKNGKVTKDDFSKQFSEHCSHMAEIVENINRQYSEFLTREAAERRVSQVRGVVADQFETTSQMLKNMAEELELFERFDFTAAQRISEVLSQAGIIPIDVSCRVDRYDRMTVEAEATQVDKTRLNKAELTRQISYVCGRTFEAPCISVAQGKCRMQMSERPVYRIQSGFFQHVAGNAQLCGDSQEMFSDGNGRQIAIISDGMGTGGRAAVDGAMAAGIMAKLIKAGIGFDCALKIVNSALLAKSGDESLATLDVAAIDLFNGKTELMKAGATVSVLRKNGRAITIDAPSLPVGILTEAKFSKETVRLSDGDLLVMFSDGVVASGDDWVRELITEWKGTVPQELAEKIVSQAMKQRNDGHDDDITVLVMAVSETKKDL